MNTRTTMHPQVSHSLAENLVTFLERERLQLQGLVGKEGNNQVKIVVPKLLGKKQQEIVRTQQFLKHKISYGTACQQNGNMHIQIAYNPSTAQTTRKLSLRFHEGNQYLRFILSKTEMSLFYYCSTDRNSLGFLS